MASLLSCFLLQSIFVYHLLFFSRVSTAHILGNETDRLALLAFKSQISPYAQHVLRSWNDSHSFCTWEGVTCSHRHQRVTVLNLDSKGVGGSISPYVGNLSFLRKLVTTNNNFDGVIPHELGRLFRLQYLDVSNNSLVGEIPVNISLCSHLTSLYLSTNNLAGNIPIELGSLSKLFVLALEENKFTGGIPSSLGNLTSLGALALSRNNLSGSIPSTLDHLKRLRVLTLSSNNLSGAFPMFFYNLSTLEILSVTGNHLRGEFRTETSVNLPNLTYFAIGLNLFSGHIPNSIFNASKLEMFDIAGNQFVGNVPLGVGNLKHLQFLNLERNGLGSGKFGELDFVNVLTNCSNLQGLALAHNRFGGRIPVSIGNLSDQLTEIHFQSNQIFGNIPAELGHLRNLSNLGLSFNLFTGAIPAGIANLWKLDILYLGYNQLSGQLPSFTSNMSRLFFLSLSHNSFEGNISSTLENQVLQELYLSDNNFSGTIPIEIGQSSRLLQVDLGNNLLHGSIPLEIGNLKNLFYFNVSQNNLSGEIPTTLGSCLSLQYVSLHGNSLVGSLPSSLSSLVDLQEFDVSRNNLSGNISKGLEKLPVLTILNLSFNNFEGEVPMKGVFRNASAVSVFGNYKLCGGISNLRLPKCPNQKAENSQKKLILKVTLGVVIPSFMVGLLVVIFLIWKKKSTVKTPPEQSLVDLKRVSYNDLHKATNGFSSANLIGMGHYGSVYKGILHQDEGFIAVKVLNLLERGASKTFLAECEVLRVVRHRNLLKILTVCSSVDSQGKDFKALVFKFMENGSLDNWLHPTSDGQLVLRCLNLDQRLNIAIDIASALDYLHNQCVIPIVHCDLKSNNVLLGDDFTAYVGDFGLAKIFSLTKNSSSLNQNETSSIAIRGTIGYIPPEYGTGAEVSTQGDVYSYGILLLEMFTGKRPTNNMFNAGLNLHSYSKRVLPQGVMEIIDTRLIPEVDDAADQLKECLSSIMRVGVACSEELTTERMDIKDVLKELHSIKASLPSTL